MEKIRLSVDSDLQGILHLYRELRPYDPVLTTAQARQAFASLLHNPQIKIIVAEVDGILAATCQLSVNPTLTNGARPFGIIEHVVTAGQYRRRGLSERVIEKALTLAWQSDCYKVMLLSGEGREPAHKLYEKVGFKAGIEKGFVIKP